MRGAILAACFLLLAPQPAAAITIVVTGLPGAPGADGQAAVATAVSADAQNFAHATAGDGGASPSQGVAPGNGGSAEATAQTGVAGFAESTATAQGGAGGAASEGTTGGAGGDAAATAIADSETLGAAAGSQAFAGAGLEGGTGGMASASATGRNLGSEQSDVGATAVGGDGGDLSATTNAPRGGDGGEARLGTVYGSSIDGFVSVGASAVGGSGGAGDPESGRPSGDGASVHLDNAVTGDTAGILLLQQFAQGGRAGEHAGGAHGDTSSRLDVVKSLQALEVRSRADGAFDAESSASAENSGGSVLVTSEAYGGDGRVTDQETPERGGDVRVEAKGTSAGDDHEVVVVAQNSTHLNAEGGAGAAAGPAALNGAGGRGGDAFSRSEGQALGDSTVTIEDRAVGGDGGFGYGLAGAPGIGGSAFSVAVGEGLGTSPVSVASFATGGRGGPFDPNLYVNPETARSGDANSTAVARGLGRVDSQANARVGQRVAFTFPWAAGESGTAQASATAEGASGEARASALAVGLELVLNAETTVPVDSVAIAEARSGIGDPFVRNSLGSSDAFAIGAGHPAHADIQAALQGNAEITETFQGDGIDIVLSLGQVGFARLQEEDGAPATQRAALEFGTTVLAVSVFQDAVVGFMNPEFLGSGFDSLRFQANVGGETLVDESFDEVGEALAYFDDRILELGGIGVACTDGGFGRPGFCFVSSLELLFDWTGSEQGDGFGVDLIVGLAPVPEPSTVLLVALGLAVLAARAHRHRRIAI